MSTFELTKAQYEELFRVMRVYEREAEKCREANIPLAGCVMLAAALEALLMATVHCFPEEVLASTSKPMKRGAPKPLIEWSLAELLSVAKELNWLPSQLSLDEEFDDDRAHIGDYAEVVRQIRNLVHPARYVEDLPGKRVTKHYLALSSDVLSIVTEYLSARIIDFLQSVADDMDNGEKSA